MITVRSCVLILGLVLLQLVLCSVASTEEVVQKKVADKKKANDDSKDYSWDYDDNTDVQAKLNRKLLISLTRDWLGRENPDSTPTYGFFPIWVFFLLLVAAFFFVLALISGILHAIGCRGRRPRNDRLIERRTSLQNDQVSKKEKSSEKKTLRSTSNENV